MQHPRWGEIVGIFSSREIKKDEELLCNYGYEVDKYLVPQWYRQAWEKHNQRKMCHQNQQFWIVTLSLNLPARSYS